VNPTDGGALVIANADTPAHVGETLTIQCSGLGMVNPPVTDGAAPGSHASTVANTVQVSIGGQQAQGVTAQLDPQKPGVYQVRAVVPAGIDMSQP
jgi:uncharacterized protein (TIGR03437 family)